MTDKSESVRMVDDNLQSPSILVPLAEGSELKILERSLADKESYIKSLEDKLSRVEREKDAHINNLSMRISALERSTTWKATAPFRKAKVFVACISALSRIAPAVIRRAGGVKGTLRKVNLIFSAQGFGGVLRAAKWLGSESGADYTGQIQHELVNKHNYGAWISHYDTLTDEARSDICSDILRWSESPLISIIMPVYNPPIDLLREAISSIQGQLYKNWELCIADDASTISEVAAYLRTVAADDNRIRVLFRSENGHIAQASNDALGLATGCFIALMDNDDVIPEHALYWVARTINENPEAGIIYSDEDKIDERGNRSAPYFKSSWNKFLFRSQNMICHLGAYKRSLVEDLGGFRLGFEGAQDYDLALRCSDRLTDEQIIHIPRILYHWRIHAGSTALCGDEKPYAALAGVAAIDEHLARNECDGYTQLLPSGMYRVHYAVPIARPLVSLIIPTKNAHHLVKQCITSILEKTNYENFEIILVDNNSDEVDSLEYFSEVALLPNVTVIRDENPFNYSALNNMAVGIAKGELVGLINNDIEVIDPDWLREMVSIALQPNVGAVGARLWYPDDRLQHGGVVIGIGGVAGHSHKYLKKGEPGYFNRANLIQEYSAVTAACLLVKKTIYHEVGGLDAINLHVAFNDVDFCLKIREKGYVNVWTPYAELYHHESATRGHEDTPEKQQRFMGEVLYMMDRWPDLKNDYAYNPNLTIVDEDFGLAWPPRV